ncbi:MAG TPA: hypothetical protein VFR37_12095 [Longimicrobium sp.]|nr:hypothetical protein [Longimicrobium sp.]
MTGEPVPAAARSARRTRKGRIEILLLACALLLAAASPASAHPGVGIVLDRRGNVFYTDLHHVWRIAPDGRRSIAVRDVHTHELAIDSAGNLFGEDNRYQGGDRYRHRVWRRTPDGRVTDVVPWRDGFWREYGFVWDRAGAMYWVQCPGRVCTIRRRTRDGRTSTFAPGVRFDRQINWIAAGPDGSLYVVDGPDLRRVTREGRLTTVARGLGEHLMGMWPDGRGSVYVAVYGARAVVRVGADGRVATVARTPAPWGPSGVAVAPNGDLWILEYSTSNEARVRRVAANGRVTVF